MLFVLASGVRGGPRSGLAAALGVASSEAIHIAAAAAGLAAAFRAMPTAFVALRLVGGVYLVFLGVRAIRNRGAPRERGSSGGSESLAYARGFLTNLVNPKMVVFTIALLPQFVAPGLGHVPLQFAVLGLTFIFFEILVDGTVGLLAGRLAEAMSRRQVRRRLEAASGLVFIGLGARLASER